MVKGRCIIAAGKPNNKGYARCTVNRIRQYAHRVAYERAKGEIPKGLQIDHLCRVRNCINPDHLEAVTNKVNAQRGLAGHHMKSLTQCRKGHPYNERTYINPGTGQRVCRTCKREWEKQYARKQKAVSSTQP